MGVTKVTVSSLYLEGSDVGTGEVLRPPWFCSWQRFDEQALWGDGREILHLIGQLDFALNQKKHLPGHVLAEWKAWISMETLLHLLFAHNNDIKNSGKSKQSGENFRGQTSNIIRVDCQNTIFN